MDIERTIEIAAPAARVSAVMRDVERWPEWTASVRHIALLDPKPFAVGSRARVRQPRLPTAVWTVTELEEDRGFTWRSVTPGLTSTGIHHVQPVSPDRSRATLAIEWRGPLAPLIRLFYGKLSRRYVELEAAGLKRRAESSIAAGGTGGA